MVSPLFFPGGNIGTLAVNGTVNDLAMCGARPTWLSAAFILEEGLPLETLEKVAFAMGTAAANPNGAAGLGLGLGAGAAVAQVMAGAMRPVSAAAVAEPPETGATKFCIECGHAIPQRAKFCADCGQAQ